MHYNISYNQFLPIKKGILLIILLFNIVCGVACKVELKRLKFLEGSFLYELPLTYMMGTVRNLRIYKYWYFGNSRYLLHM